MTVIYSQPDGGRTSLAKRMALSAHRQGLGTVYYDVENKLMLHDPSVFEGIVLARSYQESGLKELVAKGLVDCIIVDTITGIFHTSHEAFLIKLRKKVPYIIVLTQMRDSFAFNKSVPAARDHVLSSAHTALYLTGKEKVTIEGIDVMRVQYQIVKYEADRSKEGTRGSFVIRKNIVDNVYSVYDYMRAQGLIRSVGKEKYFQDVVGEIPIGLIKKVVASPDESKHLIELGLKEMKLKTEPEVYLD